MSCAWPAELRAPGARTGRDAVPPHGGITLAGGVATRRVPRVPRAGAGIRGPVGHAPPEGRSGQPRAPRRPSCVLQARSSSAASSSGSSARLRPAGHGLEEHDALVRTGGGPALRDQVPGRPGIAGAQRGQVAAALAFVAQPPGVIAGPGMRRDEGPVGVEPGQPAGPRSARQRGQTAQFRVGRRDPPRPVEQRRQHMGGNPAPAGQAAVSHSASRSRCSPLSIRARRRPAAGLTVGAGSGSAAGTGSARSAGRPPRRATVSSAARSSRMAAGSAGTSAGVGTPGTETRGTAARSVPIRLAVTRSCHVLTAAPSRPPSSQAVSGHRPRGSTRRPPSPGIRRRSRTAASSRRRPGAAAGRRRPRRTRPGPGSGPG